MSRRSSKKIIAQEIATDKIETIVTPKGHKARADITEATVRQASSRSNGSRNFKEESDSDDEPLVTPKKSSTKLKTKNVKAEVPTEGKNQKKAPVKRKAKTEDGEAEGDVKAPKKRKSKEEKEAEAMPLAGRTVVGTLKKAMHIGAHVSGAGGVQNSINNALHIGGNSFALFLKSQRKWISPALSDEARDQFKKFCEEYKYDAAKHVLPHGSYLVNLAQAEPEKAKQAYDCFLDDLQRCEALGIKLYNFHPGNTGPHPRPDAIARIAAQLNKAHKATSSCYRIREYGGAGNVIGSKWEDLRDIIELIDDKSRVGVCIDTCHTFAAGYDLRSPEEFKKTMDSFGTIVGMHYLRALHLNDSKAPFSSNRDLHANIGTGFLGLKAFHNVVNYEPFQHLPMVLETPIDMKGPDGKVIEDKSIWATEIKLLEGLIGTDTETEDFKKEEQRLQEIGAEERKKFQAQVVKKQQKTIDTMFKKGTSKKKKTKKQEDEDSDDSDGGCSH